MEVEKSTHWQEQFLERLKGSADWDSWTLFKMNYEMTESALIQEFKGLKSLQHLPNLKPFPHQIEVATTVIEKMNGKAILADEVGLGKTIEAGLILKEYFIRGLVKKALILAPASLVHQWVEELGTKFMIPALAYRKNSDLTMVETVVMSIDAAKRSPHRERIFQQDYDLIIIDEAHKLKNAKTQNYQFVQQLKKKFCLLLTATPIQNNIFELFHLISLLKPGHLGNAASFQSMFKAAKRQDEAERFVHELVHQVMVRTTRSETDLEWTKRHVEGVSIQFTAKERAVYEKIQALKDESPVFSNAFTMMTLQKELCSSKEATALTLEKIKQNCALDVQKKVNQLLEELMALEVNAKAEKVYELIQQADDKVIIFTEYEASQLFLQSFLLQKGISSVPFNGRFSKNKRDWMKQLFKEKAQVLIATESGSEGINLQFCNTVINYDLPWNPMKLEQRIGRVHRIGQEKPVHVYNLAVQDTIEDHILTVLYEKIDVFENVIGELDELLSRFDQQKRTTG